MGRTHAVGWGALLLFSGCTTFVSADPGLDAAGSTSVSDTSTTGSVASSTGRQRDVTDTGAPGLPDSGAEATSSSSGLEPPEDTDDTTGDRAPVQPDASSSSGDPVVPRPGCDNDFLDVSETDVDCGGTCSPCDAGQTCAAFTDCSSAACISGYCSASELVVWLDSSREETIHQAETCDLPALWDGDSVQCWQNLGLAGDALVVESGDAVQTTPEGILVDGSYLLIDSPFDDQPVGDVWIVLVSTLRGDTNSFDLNLAHPVETGSGRYSAHLPWGGNERLFFDPGIASRLQSQPSIIGLDERHLFGLLNSQGVDLRAIRLDGAMVTSAQGGVAQATGDLSIGRGSDLAVEELRVYQPAPPGAERIQIEGELACKWSIRDQLPADHAYFHATADSEEGCPDAPEG